MKDLRTVTLKNDAPMREIWPDGEVPVLHFNSTPAELEGEGEREVYMVDVSRLDADTLTRAVNFMANKFGASADEIRADIMRDGHFPLRAQFVVSPPSIPLRFIL